MISQPGINQADGKFKDDSVNADKDFEKEYKLEIEKMKSASQEAGKEAFIETWEKLKKKLNR